MRLTKLNIYRKVIERIKAVTELDKSYPCSYKIGSIIAIIEMYEDGTFFAMSRGDKYLKRHLVVLEKETDHETGKTVAVKR